MPVGDRFERGLEVGEGLDVVDLRRFDQRRDAAPRLDGSACGGVSGNGQMRADLAEIAALKKEVARLRAERDILKKATAFFAREVL